MLSDNIKRLRSAAGLSQEELARKLHVVRQTVSKWEKGLSVPDADMLIALARALGSSPAALLAPEGEQEVEAAQADDLAERLEELNAKLAEQLEKNRRLRRALSIAALAAACLGLLIQLLPRPHGFFAGLYLSRAAGSIIGGADGPTAIYVGGSGPNWGALLILSALFILSILGLVKTRRR